MLLRPFSSNLSITLLWPLHLFLSFSSWTAEFNKFQKEIRFRHCATESATFQERGQSMITTLPYCIVSMHKIWEDNVLYCHHDLIPSTSFSPSSCRHLFYFGHVMVEAFVNWGMADCGHMLGSQIYVEAIVCYRVMEEEVRIYLLKIKKIINLYRLCCINWWCMVHISICLYIHWTAFVLYFISQGPNPIQGRWVRYGWLFFKIVFYPIK